MKKVCYFANFLELQKLADREVQDFIFAPKELSRLGKNDWSEIILISKFCRDQGLGLYLEWNILMTEDVFKKKISFVETIDLNLFDSIRVQDMGAMEWCFNNTNLSIQVIAETGNHNSKALQTYESYLGSRLERLILSNENSKTNLEQYKQEVKTPIEIQGYGRILIFYSPRSLVSPLNLQDSQAKAENKILNDLSYIEVEGNSEESPHKGFPIVENEHGTFMFYTKDICLFDRQNEIEFMGVDFFRLDFRFVPSWELKEEILKNTLNFSKESYRDFKENYPVQLIRGFYQVNKTKNQFKFLKNQRRKRVDDNFIGEVIESKKGNYLALIKKSSTIELKKLDSIKIITPEGKVKIHEIRQMKNSSGKLIESHLGEGLILINHLKGTPSRSVVYLNSENNNTYGA